MSGNRIFTPKTISEYCDCFGVEFTYHERYFILQMKEWAVSAIAKVKEEKE